MKNPSYPEAIYMVRMKRDRAKAALSVIIERYGVISYEPVPGLNVLLDYFNNMVYGLELLLKVLSKDWDVTGQSRFQHNFGRMYEEVFKRRYTKSDLMDLLKQAILDQKYIYEPGDKLLDRVPEVEELWDELKTEFCQRNYANIQQVVKDVTMGSDFGQYLAANVARFYRPQPVALNPHAKEERIHMLEYDVACLQKEIEHLRGSKETPEEEQTRVLERMKQEFLKKLESLGTVMKMNFEMSGGDQLRFTTWTVNWIGGDFLG